MNDKTLARTALAAIQGGFASGSLKTAQALAAEVLAGTAPPVLGKPPDGRTTVLNATRVVSSSAPTVTVQDLSPDQREVYEAVLRWYETKPWERNPSERVFSFGGCAGTGKSALTALIIQELAVNRRKRLAVVAPTAKASNVIARKLGNLAAFCEHLGTVHSFLYTPVLDEYEQLVGWSRRFFEKMSDGSYVAKGRDKLRVDLVIVDESSMVDRAMEKDIEALNLPILAVGDHAQLEPVQGVSSWMKNPRMKLEKVHRQAEESGILALATFVRENGELPRNKAALEDIGISYFRSLKAMGSALIESHESVGFQESVILTYTNAARGRLNKSIHKHYFGSETPTEGTQVICLRNNNDIGLINGMRGRIRNKPVQQGVWLIADIEFPDDNVMYSGPFLAAQFGLHGVIPNVEEAAQLLGIKVPTMRNLGAFMDYGFALTVHKSQGSQFRDVFVGLEQSQPREYAKFLYTALTRASERLSFVEL